MKKQNRDDSVDIQLECFHVLIFSSTGAPHVGDHLYCHQCGGMKFAIRRSACWVVKCTKCSYARYFPEGKLTALTYAAKHMTMRRHSVETWYSGDKRSTLEMHKFEQKETLFAGEFPF